MDAARDGKTRVVMLLLEAGANPSAQTTHGRTALSIAEENQHEEVARLLREAGAVKAAPLPDPAAIPWPATGEPDRSSPESVLYGYMLAMNRWEVDAANKWKPDTQEFMDRLNAIFAEFCTDDTRKYRRQAGFSYGTPPTYDPEKEYLTHINYCTPRRAELTTRDTKWNFDRIYIVEKKKDGWRLRSKKNRPVGSNEWTNDIL